MKGSYWKVTEMKGSEWKVTEMKGNEWMQQRIWEVNGNNRDEEK